MNTEKIVAKKAYLTVLEKLADSLEAQRKDVLTDYRIIGKEDEQAKNWKTGELLWEDEAKTIPKYENKWGYADIPEEELSEEAKATLKAIDDVEKSLEKLI